MHESTICLFPPPPTRIAYTIKLLLHDSCKIYDPPPTPPFYSRHHAILVIAISCKGQEGDTQITDLDDPHVIGLTAVNPHGIVVT